MNFIVERLSQLLRSVTNKKSLTILSVALVLIALPLTVYIGQQRQDIRQRASGGPLGYAPAGTCSDQSFSDLTTAQGTVTDLALAASCLNQSVYNYCVVRGFGDNTFRPNDNLTRAEFVAFIVRYHGNIFPAGHPQRWDLMTTAEIDSLPVFPNKITNATTGKEQFRLLDIPSSYPLAREIYTSQKYGFIKGYQDGTFQPSVTWNFGFHGITRNDQGIDPNYNDSFNNPYNFAAESGQIKRGEFISQLYQYGKDPVRAINGQIQLAACFQPTAVPPTATSVPVTPTNPPTSSGGTVTQNASCSNTLSDVPTSLNQAMGCYHNTTASGYCIVRGNGTTLGPNDNLSRAEYVAFIVRYHNQVFPVGNANHWDLITRAEYDALDGTTGKKKFPDVNPDTYSLWQEIYTSQKYGFVVGQLDGNFYPNDLWTFGFHGITRNDQWPAGTGYDFNTAGNSISRGTFIQQLFDYGKTKAQLTACFPVSTTYMISGVVSGVTAATNMVWNVPNGALPPVPFQTDASGNYAIRDLSAGTYLVSVVSPSGKTATPLSYTVKVGDGCTVTPAGESSCGADGNASKVNFSVTQTPPVVTLTAPANLRPSGSITEGQTTVQWDAVIGADSYEYSLLDQTLNTNLPGCVVKGGTNNDTGCVLTFPATQQSYNFLAGHTYRIGVSAITTSSSGVIARGPESSVIITAAAAVSQTPSTSPTQARINLEVIFRQHGIGLAADNANPNATPLVVSGTIMPFPTPVDLFRNRAVTVYLSTGTSLNDGTPQYEYQKTGTALYSPDNSGFYKGVIDLGTDVPAGQYIVAVRTSNSLSQQATGFVTITPTNTVIVNFPALVSGNVYDSTIDNTTPTNDNQLDILDYNAIMDNWLNPDLCTTSNNQTVCNTIRTRADLNADGVVDVLDYNLFIRELSVQRGR